jgi:hypothetical protein
VRKWLILAAPVALAACGKAGLLEPMPGKALPPRPYGAATTPLAPQLLKPSQQARPTRSDELLTNSDKRRGGEFDLPPPN